MRFKTPKAGDMLITRDGRRVRVFALDTDGTIYGDLEGVPTWWDATGKHPVHRRLDLAAIAKPEEPSC